MNIKDLELTPEEINSAETRIGNLLVEGGRGIARAATLKAVKTLWIKFYVKDFVGFGIDTINEMESLIKELESTSA